MTFWELIGSNVISWLGVAFAITAALTNPFAPFWLFTAFILASLTASLIGLCISQREWRKIQLKIKMDAAFGKPDND